MVLLLKNTGNFAGFLLSRIVTAFSFILVLELSKIEALTF